MNPWVIGFLGLIIGAIPSIFFYTQVSPLQRKLQQAEKNKDRAEQAFKEADDELQHKKGEIAEAKSKIPDLEAHYRREIEQLEQSYRFQIQELQQAQGKIPDLEAQIEEMKTSQVRVMELEAQLAQLQQLQAVSLASSISEEQLQALQEQHQAEIQQLQQDNQGQIQALQEQHQTELAEWLETHQTQLQEIELRYQAELKTLESTYQQQILEVQQDFEERIAQAESASSQSSFLREDLNHHPPISEISLEETVIPDTVSLRESQPLYELELEDQDFLVREFSDENDLNIDETDSAACLEALDQFSEADDEEFDENFLYSLEEGEIERESAAFVAEIAEIEVIQSPSIAEDIAGLDEFLQETEEDEPLEAIGIPSLESPQESSVENDFAGFDEFLQETEEDEPLEAIGIPSLESPQESSVENDFAGFDEFLQETEEDEPLEGIGIPSLESPQESSVENDFAGFDEFLQETEEDEPLEGIGIPSLESPQESSVENDFAGFDEFLSDTSDFETENPNGFLETFSEKGLSLAEQEFLSSLQQTEAPPVHPEWLEDPSTLPDLADLSENEDDFFNMLSVENQEDDDLPSEPLANLEDPFADIFGGHTEELPEANGNYEDKTLEMFDLKEDLADLGSEDSSEHALEGFDELFNMELLEQEVSASERK